MEINESNPFFLTRSASLDLLEIEEHSLKKWGEIQTETYISLLYERFHYLANNPKTGNSWKYRADPIMMAPAGEHFIIYEPFDQGVIIITLLHSRQNIERIISKMERSFFNEIIEIKNKLKE